MKLPANTLIAPEKLTHYLLLRRDEDGKSLFLAEAGYTLANTERLMADLRQLLSLESELIDVTEYGPKYRIRGALSGPNNGRVLQVVTIGMNDEALDQTKFVTLYPDKS